MDNKIFLDIETVPSGDPIDPCSLIPPGNISKQETIDKWHRENGPQLAEELYKKRALNSMQGEIICVGLCLIGGETQIILGDSEKETMERLSMRLAEIRGQWHEPLHFVGWNITTFDLPWLWRKAIKYNLTELRDSIPRDNKHLVTDLMKVWAAEWKDYNKMSDVAEFLGIPHDATFTGQDVYMAWLTRDYDKIMQHCRGDIETTMEIYKRIMGG